MRKTTGARAQSPSDPGSIIVVSKGGRVIGRSAAARTLLGRPLDENENTPTGSIAGSAENPSCWSLMRETPGAQDLPCREGCVGEGFASPTGVRTHAIRLRDQSFELRCEPVGDQIVTALHPMDDTFSSSACPPPVHGEESPPTPKAERLTPREVEVLELLSEGLDGTEIAENLGISPGTVRTHVEHMRASLGCRTRAGLVSKGYRLRYLT